MNYALIFVGAILSFLSHRWSLYYLCHPDYYRLKGRSDATQVWFETVSNLMFFGGYGLIIFSSGLRLSGIGMGLGIVVLLHLVVFPMCGPRLRRLEKGDGEPPDTGDG